MNNYSFLEKLLHRLILSPKFMREMLFDLEKKIFSNDNFDYKNDHVFISGLARSGSTILLNTIYQSRVFSTFTYSDMPFIMSPNLWGKLNSRSSRSDVVERFHEDGIKIATNSPEAFEEVFWMTYDDSLAIQKK